MKLKSVIYFDPKRYSVERVENDTVKEMIVNNHYLRRWPTNVQHCFGIKQDQRDYVGAIVYGEPHRPNLHTTISPLLKHGEVIELQRVWIQDGTGSGIETWSIAQTFRFLPPEIRVIVSYSDQSMGHRGKIYQGLNGIYQEIPSSSETYQINMVDPNISAYWMTSRSQQRWFGRHNLDDLKHKIGRRFWRKKEATKYRYLWVRGNKKKRKVILDSIKEIRDFSPYPEDPKDPKEVCERSVIETIDVSRN